MRQTVLENDAIYHVFNRGVDKRDVFTSKKDFERFYTSLQIFNCLESPGGFSHMNMRELNEFVYINELVDILTYCLNPNHFHLLLRQKVDGGISKFMERVSKGYTQYFNLKNERSGSLFEGPFKAVLVEEGDHLDYLATYVGRNDEVHGYAPQTRKNVLRGYEEYALGIEGLCNDKETIMKKHKSIASFKKASNTVLKDIRKNKIDMELRKVLLT